MKQANFFHLENKIYYSIANIKNPSVNRWGLNTFWFNFWFADHRFFLNLQIDNLINSLVYNYIFYGLQWSKQPFYRKYFYLQFSTITPEIISYNLRYYTKELYINEVSNLSEPYTVRTAHENIFNSKISILRYQQWILVFCSTFKIIKTSRIKRRIKKPLSFYEHTYHYQFTKSHQYWLKRLKLIFLFTSLTKIKNKRIYYLF